MIQTKVGEFMRRALTSVCVLLSGLCALPAQTEYKAEFDVVSIKPSPPPTGRAFRVGCDGGPGSKDPGLYNCVNMSLSNLVTMAYKISYYQLSAPDWAGTMFEIHARVPEGATKDDLPRMIQHMLSDRFKLAVHHETRDLQKYDLVVAKNGPKFQEAAPLPPPKEEAAAAEPPKSPKPSSGPLLKMAADGFPDLDKGRAGMGVMNGRARLQNPEMTMKLLASQLASQMASPVTDATGLTGKYDISLHWVTNMGLFGPRTAGPDGPPAPPDEEAGPTLMQALQDQLGLRLQPAKGPVDFIVVDHAEKTPSEN